jgi:hypothetical protein
MNVNTAALKKDLQQSHFLLGSETAKQRSTNSYNYPASELTSD